MTVSFAERFKDSPSVPLAWAGSTSEMNYLNFGDALSPVMVSLLSSKSVHRVPTKSLSTRMGAVGTIGHGFGQGEVWFWGTGCSSWANPSASLDERVPFTIPPDSNFHIAATRGPVSESLLAGPTGNKPGVYGDPVWLMPRFYRPEVKKKWKLGVILHLSELADRTYEAVAKQGLKRFDIPAEFKDDVHLITTVTPIGMEHLQYKFDEILACERIVSTSLHGMVIAESYGIPCLYFSPGAQTGLGLQTIDLDPNGPVDLRIVDLYTGMHKKAIPAYIQPRPAVTDWADVISSIDRAWQPVDIDAQALIDAFPLPYRPIEPAAGETIWQSPILTGLKLQHDVAELRRADKLATAEIKKKSPEPVVNRQEGLRSAPSTWTEIPLSWAASTTGVPYANLGDALSAVVVSAVSGLPIRHAGFDAPGERVVGVGTIGHAQRNGVLHFWGTGMDATRNAVDRTIPNFVKAPDTTYQIHATRGPQTASTLAATGIEVSGVYGDPVWLLPQIWPMRDVEKKYRIGVILHLTELDEQTPNGTAKAELSRYQLPYTGDGSSVHLINTLTEKTVEALEEKVREILSCDLILSTSLHGLVIAETYGIPCAWFATYGDGTGARLDLKDPNVRVDHRLKDFYLGAGTKSVLAYCLDRSRKTDWEGAASYVRANWTPLTYSGDALVEAFPLPVAAKNSEGLWVISDALKRSFKF